MKNKEDIKFEIDQLRQDKIIYATESVACTLAMFLFMFCIGSLFPSIVGTGIFVSALMIGFGYWLFTVYGNTKRFIEIKKLEKLLQEKKVDK